MTKPNLRGPLKSFAGLGFRHITEDALTILRDVEIEEVGRRDYVIDAWFQHLQQAVRGMALADQDSFFLGPAKKIDFHTFLFLEKHFKRNQLRVTNKIFQRLKKGWKIKDGNKKVAVEFFEVLLKRHQGQGWIREPRDRQLNIFQFA